MTKAELTQKLIEQGKTADELKGLKVAELEALLEPEANAEPPIRIVSKRQDGTKCYWLEDGTKLPWSELSEFFTKDYAISPPHKAKDYAQKVNGEWILLYRNEVEK